MSDESALDPIRAELRRRLEEAEETLRAIREGEVDALVVRRSKQDEVFTLAGGTESYRAFMEAMDLGAAAFDDSGRLLYANKALGKLLGAPEAGVASTQEILGSFDPNQRLVLEGLISNGRDGRQSAELRLPHAGTLRHLLVTAAPLPVGVTPGVAVTFMDITARLRAAAAEEAERAARAILSSTNEAVVVCDTEGVITHANAAVRLLREGSVVGQRLATAIPLVFPAATGLIDAESLVAMLTAGNSFRGLEAIASGTRARDVLVSGAPLRATGDVIKGCVITLVDLSQRKAAEKQQVLLMAELDHRVKNTLALVHSICSRTLSHAESLDAFRGAFLGRIQALAATHNLLADKSWAELLLSELVEAELSPYLAPGDERVEVAGLEIGVAPRAAVPLGLIFHELVTNAVKYGALSNENGRVSVRRISLDEQMLRIEWRESGGPVVQQPTRQGFGQTVIARSLQYSPHGRTEVRFEPPGLVCIVDVPREDVTL